MKCPHCGQNLTEGARFCNRCGQPVARQPVPPENQKSGKTCSYCGQSLLPGARFCNKCGKPLTPEPRPEDQAPAEPVLPEEKTESFRQEAPAPKRRSPIGVVAVVVILVLLAAGGWWFANQLKEDQTLPASSAVEQMEEQMASSWQEEKESALEPTSEPEVLEKAEPVPEESAEEPIWTAESGETAPAAEETISQEIRITPRGDGMADLVLFQQEKGEWKTLFECEAAIGRNGTTNYPTEGDGKTPAGTFPVLFCYGLEQPETTIPFIQLTPDSVWVDDSRSEYYNCLTTRQQAGSVSFEETYSQFVKGYYSCNIFFANNGDGRTPGSATPGAGSVRVLEGSLKPLEPTNGDIKISSQDMETLLGMLDAAYSPVVTVAM